MRTRLFSFFIIFLLLCNSLFVFSRGKSESKNVSKTLTIYAYDSFAASWAGGPDLMRLFEEKTGIKTELISCGDATQVLVRAQLEKKQPRADILIGIDNNLVDRAREADILEAYKSPLADSVIPADLILTDDWLLTPYDWSFFGINYDTASNIEPPASLEDLCAPRFEKKLVIMDPRTSTPGLGFLTWTMAVYGPSWASYWERLRPSILTMAPGWSTGYGLYTSGEAPLVLSYTTSPAYHAEYENTDRYQVLIFDEGHISQIEGMGIAKGTKNLEAAKAFIDFMLTDEAQAILPLTQWMYPVSTTVELPASYDLALKTEKHLASPTEDLDAAIEKVLQVLAK